MLYAPSVRPLLVAVVVVVAAPAGLGAELAVHPALGDAPPPLAEAIAEEARAAIRAQAGVEVLDAETTRSELEVAVTMGVACAPDDLQCLAKTAVVLQVRQLVVPRLAMGEGAVDVQLTRIDAETARVTDRATMTMPVAAGPERTARVAELVAQVLDGEAPVDAAPAAEPEREPTVEVEELAAVDAEQPDEVALSPVLLGGVGTAGLGAAVAVVGTAGAAWMTLLLTTDLGKDSRYEDRQLWQGIGQTFVYAAAAGGVLLLAGGIISGAALLE